MLGFVITLFMAEMAVTFYPSQIPVDLNAMDKSAKTLGYDPSTRNVTNNQVCYTKKISSDTTDEFCMKYTYTNDIIPPHESQITSIPNPIQIKK